MAPRKRDNCGPLSVAERAALYRKRKGEEYRSREKLRMRATRQRAIQQNGVAKHREIERLRKRESRARARRAREQGATATAPESEIHPGYSCIQTLGKALGRARRGLPTCPIKRNTVIRALCQENNVRLRDVAQKELHRGRSARPGKGN